MPPVLVQLSSLVRVCPQLSSPTLATLLPGARSQATCTHRPGPRCCQWGRNAAGWWWRPGLALVSCQFVEEPQSEQRPAAAAWCGAGAGRGADIEILEHTHSSHDELQCAAVQCGDTGDMQRTGQSFVKLCTETPAPVPRRTLLILLDHLRKRKVDICHDCDCPDCCRAVLVDTPIRILWMVETGNM